MGRRIILFSVNDFDVVSGGTIRMQGILNALAENGNDVTFLSNTQDYSKFHPNIHHVYLNHPINQYSKRKFQLFLTYLPPFIFNLYYRKLLKKLKIKFAPYTNDYVIFFEYLDNSMGYWLKKNNIIKGYINDIHGIAPEEFKFQINQANSLKEKLKLKLKQYTAWRLDQKVFDKATKIIFPTKAMESYWSEIIPAIKDKKNYLIPNVLQSEFYHKKPNQDLIDLKKEVLNINTNDKVILFAGGFKRSSGILLLIKAFAVIQKENLAQKLLLVGDGPLKNEAKRLVSTLKLHNDVVLTGFTEHNELRGYQDLAHVIVCPDEDNIFSHLIVHFKYLDALLANKVVINGNFRSVLEINPNEELSLGFEPSNLNDLTQVLRKALINYDFYSEKYDNTRDFVIQKMVYKHQTKVLEESI